MSKHTQATLYLRLLYHDVFPNGSIRYKETECTNIVDTRNKEVNVNHCSMKVTVRETVDQ